MLLPREARSVPSRLRRRYSRPSEGLPIDRPPHVEYGNVYNIDDDLLRRRDVASSFPPVGERMHVFWTALFQQLSVAQRHRFNGQYDAVRLIRTAVHGSNLFGMDVG